MGGRLQDSWCTRVPHPLRFFKLEDTAAIIIALVSTLMTPSSILLADSLYANMHFLLKFPDERPRTSSLSANITMASACGMHETRPLAGMHTRLVRNGTL